MSTYLTYFFFSLCSGQGDAYERGGGVGAKYDEGAMAVVSLIFLLLKKLTLLCQKPIGEIGANKRKGG
jgi:hypothetical protein